MPKREKPAEAPRDESQNKDAQYFELFIAPLISCSRYKPKFGKGGTAGVDLEYFRRMYGEDPFYSWVGLDSPLMYAAHKAAGGMTSIYRQLGIGGERVFNKILQDTLKLSAEQAAWTYKIPVAGTKDRTLALDGRIELEDVQSSRARMRVKRWVDKVSAELLPEDEARPLIRGVVFEVRQGYKSKDSKRQNADIGNASSAYANLYIPTLFLLSTQIDGDIALRYQQARWLLLTGSVMGSDTESSYVFLSRCSGVRFGRILSAKLTKDKGKTGGSLSSTPLSLKYMKAEKAITPNQRFTFKGNQKHTRYGWLRLTPAYSVHLVSELLDQYAEGNDAVILDPFCGTGTTAMACAERGITCDTADINPFLIWLTEVKTRPYARADLDAFRSASMLVAKAMTQNGTSVGWLPPLHQIEKWWNPTSLLALGRGMRKINDLEGDLTEQSSDLLKVAFCRVAIEQANVSFGHQSMSFKKEKTVDAFHFESLEEESAAANWEHAVASIDRAASSPIVTQPRVLFCDARELSTSLRANKYSCVITSPPYPNRMSYIRELRPYMYWLGYLKDHREAGDLDWKAIGGTWGSATSNVGKWQPPSSVQILFPPFESILTGVAKHSRLLSRYIHKYFYDMVHHCDELFRVVKPRGVVNYIVGNSKFYDVMLPVESIFAAMFEAAGFENIEVRIIRKRTSKKELFEFVVSARKPD